VHATRQQCDRILPDRSPARLLFAGALAFVCAPALAAPRDRTPWAMLAEIYQPGQHESAFGVDARNARPISRRQ